MTVSRDLRTFGNIISTFGAGNALHFLSSAGQQATCMMMAVHQAGRAREGWREARVSARHTQITLLA